ncbi:hypothetical protein DVH05_022463 [Phytophthora capsici]|nr:hypothetical protein DVH05_022463 [Phytophthora capsici]
MKVFIPIVTVNLIVSAASGAAHDYVNFVSSLTASSTSSAYMKPVHVVHARAQSDAPVWYDSIGAFGSKYGGSTDAEHFRGALDTVNTASVEGALMYVQAEGINYNTRSADDKCWRKNNMKWVVFYDIVFAQTNETLAEYGTEYGPYIAMDGGQCTPTSGTNAFSKECISLNGNSTVPELGPFVGGEARDTDPRAPYPNCRWYSLPNNCPLKKWSDTNKDLVKDDTCRANTRQGLCDIGKLPDGVTCTYNYRILGYVPIDDVVGITSMKDSNNNNYADFKAFCQDGQVEFKATEAGVWAESIPFWEKPQDQQANADRAQKLLDTYSSLLTSGSSQIATSIVDKMVALPTKASLIAENPPCYKNVKECAQATYGCKRDLYGQICTVCNAAAAGCKVAPSGFKYPTLEKAVTLSGNTSTPTTASSAVNLAMTVGTLIASFGLSVLMS